MHRTECVPCSRLFSNKEALQQHLKTSSAWHPVCVKCDKRFSSTSGLEAHTAAKHPPTFDCNMCGREYHQSFALDDHYRGSPNHPNCPRCGKGFRDEQELQMHQSTFHPKVRCVPCDELVYQDQDCLKKHYEISPNHPNCKVCNQGCQDEDDLLNHTRSHEGPVEDPDSGLTAPAESSNSANGPQQTVAAGKPDLSLPSPSSKFPFLENTSPVNVRHPQYSGEGDRTSRPAIFHTSTDPAPFVPEWGPPTSSGRPGSSSNGTTSSTGSAHSNGKLSSLTTGSPFLPLSSELHSTPLLQTAPLTFTPGPLPPPNLKPPSNLHQALATRSISFNASMERGEIPFLHSGFTPLNPKTNAAIRDPVTFGRGAVETPPLCLSMGLGTSLMNVQAPPFSPLAGLMPPSQEANKIWAAKENRQVASNSPPRAAPTRPPAVPFPVPALPPLSQPSLANGKAPANGSTPLVTTAAPEWRQRSSPTATSTTTSSSSSTRNIAAEFLPSSPAAVPFVSSSPRVNRFASLRRPHAGFTSTASLIEQPVIARPSRSPTRSLTSTVGSAGRTGRGPPSFWSTPPYRDFSPGRASTDSANSTHLLPRRLSPPFNFSPRLYPGSARQALREALVSGVPSPGSVDSSSSPFNTPSTFTSVSSSPAAQLSVGLTGNTPQRTRHRGSSSDIINWQSLLGDDEDLFTEIETPRAESPSKSTKAEALITISSPALSTSSFAFVTQDGAESSPKNRVGGDDKSIVENSKLLSSSVVKTNTGRLYVPELIFSTSIASSTSYPHSPEVSSPFGLQRLPSLSPLPHTPDFSFSADIPEALHPLPESVPASPGEPVATQISLPLAHSPFSLLNEDDTKDAREDSSQLAVPEIGHASVFSSPGSGSYMTSPQDPLASPPPPEESEMFKDLQPGSPQGPTNDHGLCSSVDHTHNSAGAPVETGLFGTPIDTAEEEAETLEDLAVSLPASTSPTSSIGHDGDDFGAGSGEDDDGETPQTAATSVTSELPPGPELDAPTAAAAGTSTIGVLSPLHCRECKMDTCEDITATMCGHIFCYKCITTAVINTSRCPVCLTPTLLYCLFRLDLAP